MAWSNRARLTSKQLKGMFRKWRLPPQPDLPPGGLVPRSVMKQIQWSRLPIPDRELYSRKLSELMQAIEANGRT
jgi:hypothetical protein